MTTAQARQQTYAVSYQLYSSRNFPPVEAHLPILKALGYDAIEPWPPAYAENPGAFRNALDRADLKCFGFHLPLTDLESDPDECVRTALALGAKHLIPPYVAAEDRRNTTEFWLGVGNVLRRAQEIASGHGLRVLWHNHDFEYSALPDGSRPIDRILEAGGKDVGYEADIGWMTRAGVPIETEFERYGDRIFAIHVKDSAPFGVVEDDGWTATGDGIIDWKSLLPLFRNTPADYVVAEHDNPSDWQRFAERSIRYVKGIGM